MNEYVKMVRNIVLSELNQEPVEVFLFGSRANGTERPGSDVDIGIIPHGKLDISKVSFLRERLEESNIPYKVDIVNFADVSEEFRHEAMKNTVIWKN